MSWNYPLNQQNLLVIRFNAWLILTTKGHKAIPFSGHAAGWECVCPLHRDLVPLPSVEKPGWDFSTTGFVSEQRAAMGALAHEGFAGLPSLQLIVKSLCECKIWFHQMLEKCPCDYDSVCSIFSPKIFIEIPRDPQKSRAPIQVSKSCQFIGSRL